MQCVCNGLFLMYTHVFFSAHQMCQFAWTKQLLERIVFAIVGYVGLVACEQESNSFCNDFCKHGRLSRYNQVTQLKLTIQLKQK